MIQENARRRRIIIAGFIVVAIGGTNLAFHVKEVMFSVVRHLQGPVKENISFEKPAEPEIPLCAD